MSVLITHQEGFTDSDEFIVEERKQYQDRMKCVKQSSNRESCENENKKCDKKLCGLNSETAKFKTTEYFFQIKVYHC